MSKPACGAGDQQREVEPSAGPRPTVVGRADTVMVIGRADIRSIPDEAVVTLTEESDGVEPALAMNANSAAMARMLERLRVEGVDDEAVETVNISVFPVRTYDPQTGQETLVGYRAQNTVTVTLRDMNMVGKVLAAAVEGGATNISGPLWRLTEDSAAVHDALTRAVEDARSKAETLAGAQGLTVGAVLMMSEGAVERAVATSEVQMQDMAGALLKGRVDPIPVNAGTLHVTATVTVVYELDRR